MLAGELAVADGDHEDRLGHPGVQLTPGLPAFGLMMKHGDKAADDIDLADYPTLAGARPEHG